MSQDFALAFIYTIKTPVVEASSCVDRIQVVNTSPLFRSDSEVTSVGRDCTSADAGDPNPSSPAPHGDIPWPPAATQTPINEELVLSCTCIYVSVYAKKKDWIGSEIEM